MAAGTSAQDEAERSSANAERLTRRAANADRRANNFDRGADGERRVADALGTLTTYGLHLLHDRRCPSNGGNIDHIAIGPSGVFVLDAKFWAGPIEVRDGKLRAGRTNRPEPLARAEAMRAEVAAALADAGLHAGPVFAGLVFVETPITGDRVVDGVAITTLESLPAALRSRPAVLNSTQVEEALRLLSCAFTPCDAPAVFPSHEQLAGPGGLPTLATLDQGYRCYYVNDWRGGGSRRLHLKSESGLLHGWRDVKTGERHVEASLPKQNAQTAAALVARIARTGPDSDAPKVPNFWWGTLLHSQPIDYLVGTRWRHGANDRLYGFLIGPKTAQLELGYVDLVTRRIVPADAEPLAGRTSTKTVLLGYLARSGAVPLDLDL